MKAAAGQSSDLDAVLLGIPESPGRGDLRQAGSLVTAKGMPVRGTGVFVPEITAGRRSSLGRLGVGRRFLHQPKAPDAGLFTGRVWTGRQALALGRLDALGSAESVIRERCGEQANILLLGQSKPLFWSRVLGSGASAMLHTAWERAAWARLAL